MLKNSDDDEKCKEPIQPTNEACPNDGYVWHCGCDGITYPTKCEARKNAGDARHEGPCPVDEEKIDKEVDFDFAFDYEIEFSEG